MLAYFYNHMWDLFKYVIFHSASFCLMDYKHLWTSLCQLPWQEATKFLRGKWEQLVADADLTVIPFPSSLGNVEWVSSTPSSSLSKNARSGDEMNNLSPVTSCPSTRVWRSTVEMPQIVTLSPFNYMVFTASYRSFGSKALK